MTCNELDGLVTRFVDDETTDAERAAIMSHLNACPACRTRVEAESTARHVVHAHASIARTMGVEPSWRPRVFRLGQPLVPVRPAALVLLGVIAAGAIAVWSRPTIVLAYGVVSDSACADDHSRFMITGERECTLGCVRRGAEFVLVTDTTVHRISNQQLAGLRTHAGARVKVEGTLDGDRILIASMSAMP